MCYECQTMTRDQLKRALSSAVRYPHGDMHKGGLELAPEVYTSDGRETNLVISPFSHLDCTGVIHVGPWCNIGPRSKIYTHDHIHRGRRPLSEVTETYGVLWQDKRIGADVWIHDGAMVLYQVTEIPDGVVIGGGAVLTRNPGPFEIWAGNPARCIGLREEVEEAAYRELVCRNT